MLISSPDAAESSPRFTATAERTTDSEIRSKSKKVPVPSTATTRPWKDLRNGMSSIRASNCSSDVLLVDELTTASSLRRS
jgi:hypothetical protein